jgi:maltose O-acetyltransferase
MSPRKPTLASRALGRIASLRDGISARLRHNHLRLQSLAGFVNVSPGVRLDVPVICNGQGSVLIGPSCSFGFSLAPMAGDGRVMFQAREPNAVIEIGEFTAISNNTSLIANTRISIGARNLIGDNVLIIDSDFHGTAVAERRTSIGKTAPVVIGDDVWIGSRAIILRGATIGAGSIVAAGAVVRGNVPPLSLIAGNPGVVIGPIG